MQSLFPQFQLGELRITGGGEKSHLWNQLKADVLQVPVRRIARSEGAPLGAALLAGYGVGLFPSLPDAAQQWVSYGQVTSPRRSTAAYYGRRLTAYEQLLEQLNRIGPL